MIREFLRIGVEKIHSYPFAKYGRKDVATVF
jgi:hypothetical protein